MRHKNIAMEWESFEFYIQETEIQEAVHLDFIQTISHFIEANPMPKRYERKRLIAKSKRSTNILLHLYQKQIRCLEVLIEYHSKGIDIPVDREVDVNSLLSLKNTTISLVYSIQKQNEKIINLLK